MKLTFLERIIYDKIIGLISNHITPYQFVALIHALAVIGFSKLHILKLKIN